jgi:hypothetical protein
MMSNNWCLSRGESRTFVLSKYAKKSMFSTRPFCAYSKMNFLSPKKRRLTPNRVNLFKIITDEMAELQ